MVLPSQAWRCAGTVARWRHRLALQTPQHNETIDVFYIKRIYLAAVSQMLRNTVIYHCRCGAENWRWYSFLKEKQFSKTAVQVVACRSLDCRIMQIIQLPGFVSAKMTATFVFCTVIRPCLAEDRLLQLNHKECDVMAFGK